MRTQTNITTNEVKEIYFNTIKRLTTETKKSNSLLSKKEGGQTALNKKPLDLSTSRFLPPLHSPDNSEKGCRPLNPPPKPLAPFGLGGFLNQKKFFSFFSFFLKKSKVVCSFCHTLTTNTVIKIKDKNKNKKKVFQVRMRCCA